MCTSTLYTQYGFVVLLFLSISQNTRKIIFSQIYTNSNNTMQFYNQTTHTATCNWVKTEREREKRSHTKTTCTTITTITTTTTTTITPTH